MAVQDHDPRGQISFFSSTTVENVVAKFAHVEDGIIGPAFDWRVSMGIDCFANDDVMIAACDDLGDRKFDAGYCALEDRGTGGAVTISLATDRAISSLGRLEEGKGLTLLAFAKEV